MFQVKMLHLILLVYTFSLRVHIILGASLNTSAVMDSIVNGQGCICTPFFQCGAQNSLGSVVINDLIKIRYGTFIF